MNFNLDNVKVDLLEHPDQVPDFLAWLAGPRRILGIDIETNALPWSQGGKSRLVQFGDLDHGWAIPAEGWVELISHALNTYERPMVLHNGAYDTQYLHSDFGWKIPWHLIHDTMHMSRVMGKTMFHGLKPLSVHLIDERCGYGEVALKNDFEKYGWYWDTVPVNLPSYWIYGALDPVLTCALFEILAEQLDGSGAERAYNIERAALEGFFMVERHGMVIDRPYCEEQIEVLEAENATLAEGVRTQFGDHWSISSGASMVKLLTENLGIPLYQMTDGGKGKSLALDKEVLAEFAWMHPLVGQIGLHRENNRLMSAYYKNFLKFSSESDPIVHPQYRQSQARTFRTSVSAPAIQQIPSRTAKGLLVRRSVIARPGHKLIACDLSQVEPRLFAHFSEDPELQQAIRDGLDFHTFVAGKAYHTATPSKQERTKAKTVGLGALYGAGAAQIAAQLGVSPEEGQEVYDQVMAGFPALKKYQQRTERWAKSTLDETGRAHMPNHYGAMLTASEDDGLYVLGNYRIQSAAAHFFKDCINRTVAAGLGQYMIAFVHDEVVCEVPDTEDIEEISVALKDALEDTTCSEFSVPFTAECSAPAATWNLCK